MGTLGQGESLTSGGYVRRADGSVIVPEPTADFAELVAEFGDVRGMTMAEIADRLGNCDPVPAIDVESGYVHTWSRPGYELAVGFGLDGRAVWTSETIGGPPSSALAARIEEERETLPPWRRRSEHLTPLDEIRLGFQSLSPDALELKRRLQRGESGEGPEHGGATAQPQPVAGAGTPPAVGVMGKPARPVGALAAGVLGIPLEYAHPAVVCPHCGVQGYVSTRQVTEKSGISGAKATGALLTAGLSVLATGLSQKQRITEAHCANCGMTWQL